MQHWVRVQVTMVFTLGTLFEAGLLLINAVAILNEEKFLKKGELNIGQT